jgi:hypothetical protein
MLQFLGHERQVGTYFVISYFKKCGFECKKHFIKRKCCVQRGHHKNEKKKKMSFC